MNTLRSELSTKSTDRDRRLRSYSTLLMLGAPVVMLAGAVACWLALIGGTLWLLKAFHVIH